MYTKFLTKLTTQHKQYININAFVGIEIDAAGQFNCMDCACVINNSRPAFCFVLATINSLKVRLLLYVPLSLRPIHIVRHDKIFLYGFDMLGFTLLGHQHSVVWTERTQHFACQCLSLFDYTTRQYRVGNAQFHFWCLKYWILHFLNWIWNLVWFEKRKQFSFKDLACGALLLDEEEEKCQNVIAFGPIKC